MTTNMATCTRRATISIACALGIATLSATLAQCSSDSNGNSIDAGADNPWSPHDAGIYESEPAPPIDAGIDAPFIDPCDADIPDGAVVSDWPGWRRLTELDRCCQADIPYNNPLPSPPYAWIPCTNGDANCQEFKADPGTDFYNARVSRDATGKPARLMLGRSPSGTLTQVDLYRIDTGEALAAWRDDLSSRSCFIVPLAGKSSITVFGDRPGLGHYLAFGDASTLMNAPQFKLLDPATPGLGTTLTSDTTFALDLRPGGVIVRTRLGSGTFTRVVGSVPVLLEMVEGDDVFGRSVHGTAGWEQLYRADANGALVLFRSNAAAHVATPATDGTTLFWTETYGTSDVTGVQTKTEFWAAPYTSDPTQLASTGKKIAEVANPGLPLEGVAFQGIYAIVTRENALFVVRLADGAMTQVSSGPNRTFAQLAAVTPTEAWAVMNGAQGPAGVAFARFSLGTW